MRCSCIDTIISQANGHINEPTIISTIMFSTLYIETTNISMQPLHQRMRQSKYINVLREVQLAMDGNSLSMEEQDQLNRGVKKARKVRLRPRFGEDVQEGSLNECLGSLSEGGKRKFSFREMVMDSSEADVDLDADVPLDEELSDEEEGSLNSDDVKFSKE